MHIINGMKDCEVFCKGHRQFPVLQDFGAVQKIQFQHPPNKQGLRGPKGLFEILSL